MQAVEVIYYLKGINLFSFQPVPGDVMHSYILPGAAWEAPAQRGTVMDSIPFTHPAHVPAVLELLRHQCVINILLRSCISSQWASPGSFKLQTHKQYVDDCKLDRIFFFFFCAQLYKTSLMNLVIRFGL